MTVANLFIKRTHGERLEAVTEFQFSPQGIANGVRCSPLRQVLITSGSVTEECGLKAGDLRENIVVDFDRLYDLPSGTVIRIGDALIRLTFHCEPCKKILHLVAFDRILHKRGYLGCFLNSGAISIGDALSVTEQKLESIPYAVKDRLRWFFGKQEAWLAAVDLVHGLGLPASHARAIPRMVEKLAITRRSPK